MLCHVGLWGAGIIKHYFAFSRKLFCWGPTFPHDIRHTLSVRLWTFLLFFCCFFKQLWIYGIFIFVKWAKPHHPAQVNLVGVYWYVSINCTSWTCLECAFSPHNYCRPPDDCERTHETVSCGRPLLTGNLTRERERSYIRKINI